MPPARSALRPILIGSALGAIVIVSPARSETPPDTTMRHALYSFTPRPARDFIGERSALEARAVAELGSLAVRAQALPEGMERAAALREMSGVLRRHRIARLRLEIDAATARGDAPVVERIARILDRFERPRLAARAGSVRIPAREGAGR